MFNSGCRSNSLAFCRRSVRRYRFIDSPVRAVILRYRVLRLVPINAQSISIGRAGLSSCGSKLLRSLGTIGPLAQLDLDELSQQFIACFEESVDNLALGREPQPAFALTGRRDSVVGHVFHW